MPRATGVLRDLASSQVLLLGFIKKAWTRGFLLDEITILLDLADGRKRRAVQMVTSAGMAEIESMLTNLTRMQSAQAEMRHRCRTTGQSQAFPIIEALDRPVVSG